MLNFFNANNKNSIKKLELILNLRKTNQKNQNKKVNNILANVKKYGDSSVIKYEKKFSKIKVKTKKIKFSDDEIRKILKKLIKN